MPVASEFLAGFGLIQGSQFDGYILTSATSTHESIKRYQEYRYSIKLVFKNIRFGTYDKLYTELYKTISQKPIIYGVRNPYRCIIDDPQYGNITEDHDGTITFHLIGHSYRA
jgi:hypothetical protein